MKLIIDISDITYDSIMARDWKNAGWLFSEELKAIHDGTPFPKGHGRLGDLDAVMNDICTSINEMTNIGIMVDSEYLWAKLNDAIDNAETIIEADTESENKV